VRRNKGLFKKPSLKTAEKHFDKYAYYSRAVQAPDVEAEFISEVYSELRGREATILCEDFCGTFKNSCEWVKQSSDVMAYGIDLDPEPLDYGYSNYFSKLKTHEQDRVHILQGDVLYPGLPKGDVVIALNFSYSFFKERSQLLKYFKNVRNRLNPEGLFIIDTFGGSLCFSPCVDEHRRRGFTYYWDEEEFNPINHHCTFHIHFKRDGEKKREKVFSYHWRLWTLPELRDLMIDAGFHKTHIYWEGSTRRGSGDGKFKRTEQGDDAGAWVAYLVAER